MDSNLIEQIRKTDPRGLFFGAITFIALIGPVMIEIYVADPGAYQALPVSKLLLLAMGATMPIAILNSLLCFAATKNEKTTQILSGTPDLNASAGLIITSFILYIDIGLQFLIGYSIRIFVVVGMVLELAVIVWSIVQIFNSKK